MSCSYADIALAKYDSLANKFHLRPRVWKRFSDDIFVLCENGVASLPLFLGYLNSMDKTGNINFTMKIVSDTGLEFFNLKLKIVGGKIIVDVFAKPTNSFSYITLSTCYPKKNICNISKSIALRLGRIWDDDANFDKRSSEYQNCLIAWEHKPSRVKEQFSKVRSKTRTEARTKQEKQDKASDIKSVTTYDPALLTSTI